MAAPVLSSCMWTLSCNIWNLVPFPGMEPVPPAVGVWSLSHWTTREVPCCVFNWDWVRAWRPLESTHWLPSSAPYTCWWKGWGVQWASHCAGAQGTQFFPGFVTERFQFWVSCVMEWIQSGLLCLMSKVPVWLTCFCSLESKTKASCLQREYPSMFSDWMNESVWEMQPCSMNVRYS